MTERCDGPTDAGRDAGAVVKSCRQFCGMQCMHAYFIHVSQPEEEPGHDIDAALRCLLLSPGADYPREAGKFDPTTTYGGDFKVQFGTIAS